MSRAGKAAEPSMEEILSSIRKIIAEEPTGLRASPTPQPATAAPQASASVPVAPLDLAPVVVTEPKPAPTGSAAAVTASAKAAVDDILELADGAPRVEAPLSSEAIRSNGSIPSWLFPAPRTDGSAEPGPAPVPAATTKTAAEPAREAPKPFFPTAPAAEVVVQPAPQPVAAPSRLGVNGSHARSVDQLARADDLGAVVPRRSPEVATAPTPGVLDRRLPQAGLPDWLSRAAHAPAKPTAPEPVAVPSEPTRLAPREPEAPAPALSELARPSMAAGAGPEAAKRAPMAAAEAAPAASISAAETTPGVAEPVVPVAAEAKPVAAADKTGSLAVTEASSLGAVPKPTLLGDRGRGPKNGSPADIVPTMTQPAGVRTLDDTIVDLLRPMIRQWLDDNMPRMVEKALRIEMAASVKAKLDQPKH